MKKVKPNIFDVSWRRIKFSRQCSHPNLLHKMLRKIYAHEVNVLRIIAMQDKIGERRRIFLVHILLEKFNTYF